MDASDHASRRLRFDRAAVPPSPLPATAAASTGAAESGAPARRIREGLLFLLESREYADDVGTDRWDFALELGELKNLGLTKSDLRWLVLKGYVEHARETTLPGEGQRSFRPSKGLNFSKQACFVITEAGIVAARSLALADSPQPAVGPPSSPAPAVEVPQPRVVPHWDADLQELRVNGLIVKQFKVPAPNQEMILAAFQEENWPPRIDDPLPPQPDQDSKRRLHDTIVSLNRNHKTRFLRFMGDGSGQGVRWTIVTEEVES